MKTLFLMLVLSFSRVAAFSQTSTQNPPISQSNFANVETVFTFMAILLVAAFLLIPVYSLSQAVMALTKKVEGDIKEQ
ncbi:hypothetical protein BH11BAC1_BH11BAC1_13400 [soil metagenome]